MNRSFFLRWVQQDATEEVELLLDKKCLSLCGGVVILFKGVCFFCQHQRVGQRKIKH